MDQSRAQERLRGQLADSIRRIMHKEACPVPEAGRDAWDWFLDLHATRTSGFAAPNAISYAEIDAYARLHRLPLQPHHVALIRAMDEAWMHEARKQAQKHKGPPDGHRQRSDQPLNVGLLDAILPSAIPLGAATV